MTLQSSGQISFGQISAEFGLGQARIGQYRVSQTVGAMKNRPLDDGVPQSGQIRFGDFYGKQLNQVVNFHSGGSESRQIARTRYNSNSVTVIGGFRSRPSSSAGTKVFIHVNKTICSAKGDINTCALRTGSWESSTNLKLWNSGNLYGAGGDGGDGGSRNNGGSCGQNGTSAFGATYPTDVLNYGNMWGGGGGAGGTSGNKTNSRRRRRWRRRKKDRRRNDGSAGSGGVGCPGGNTGRRRNAGGGGDWGNSGSRCGGAAGRYIVISGSGSGTGFSVNSGSVKGGAVSNTNPQ